MCACACACACAKCVCVHAFVQMIESGYVLHMHLSFMWSLKTQLVQSVKCDDTDMSQINCEGAHRHDFVVSPKSKEVSHMLSCTHADYVSTQPHIAIVYHKVTNAKS